MGEEHNNKYRKRDSLPRSIQYAKPSTSYCGSINDVKNKTETIKDQSSTTNSPQ